ncbi:hypothetical protein [Sinorhizobium glycinis]|uniref:hypothetical protein n=1 Tax=Sinorhizobium glycinis TaxID=1472378 RepID=UPI003CC7A40F
MLVDRLWPRGIAKDKVRIDLSRTLRRAMGCAGGGEGACRTVAAGGGDAAT